MSDGGHDFAGMYAEGIPPWQIDRPQPEVIRLIEQGKFESPVLDLGCGTGDNTIELARRGLLVKGLDAVTEALERARKKNGAGWAEAASGFYFRRCPAFGGERPEGEDSARLRVVSHFFG